MRSILRSGYTQHRTRKVIRVTRKDGTSYTFVRKSGTSRVRPVPIPDVGAAGKGPSVIGPLKHGMLTKFGYHPVEAMTNRRKSLRMAIVKGGEQPLAVMRRLIAISTLSKRSAPRASRIYKSDAKWVYATYCSK